VGGGALFLKMGNGRGGADRASRAS
jgi:hypothetical protein